MLKIIRSPKKFQKLMASLKKAGKRVGFVPTMGALHEGHLTLVRAARKENDAVAVSIFVNPAQFGPKEDFRKYPRTLREDRALLGQAKADFLFLPSASDMYPEGFLTRVEPGPLGEVLCGKFRPGHFRGVASVVAKLFNLALPSAAYFGQKDYQQCAIIRRMVRDLNFPLALRVLPTVRERDGLAMSSRNRYLTPEERTRALEISRTLFALRDEIRRGGRNLRAIRAKALDRLRQAADRVEYLELVHPETLRSLARPLPGMVALAACFVGKTRLIDNVIIPGLKRG